MKFKVGDKVILRYPAKGRYTLGAGVVKSLLESLSVEDGNPLYTVHVRELDDIFLRLEDQLRPATDLEYLVYSD